MASFRELTVTSPQLRSTEVDEDVPQRKLLNINTGDEICSDVPQTTVHQACAIADHRCRNWDFKPLEQLVSETSRPSVVIIRDAGLVDKPPKRRHSKSASGRSVVNVNTANYHELCVLKEITPELAVNIVERRTQTASGRFSAVDELLTVQGMNGHILKAVSGRITVGCAKIPCEHSDPPQVRTGKRPKSVVNINLANYHELSTLPGITEEIAKSIVTYKVEHCKGHFTTIQQLLGVPSMNFAIMNAISSRIVFGNKGGVPSSNFHDQLPEQKTTQRNTTSSGGSGAVKICVHKPPKPLPRKQCSIRIASWNLKCFTLEKAHAPGVLEIICSTILHHGLDLITFQELADQTSLKLICDELNQRSLPKLKAWPTELKHSWKYCCSEKTGRMFQGMEYNGFVWNEKRGLHLDSTKLEQNLPFVRQPFIGNFQLGGWNFAVISVHLRAEGWSGEHSDEVNNEIRLLPLLIQKEPAASLDVILLGDFNMRPDVESFNGLLSSGYTPLLDASVPTNISPRIPNGNRSYDNIWVTTSLQSERYNGQCEVIRRGLQKTVTIGQKPVTVSDHCPVWAGFIT